MSTLSTFSGLSRAVVQLRAEQAASRVDKAILQKLLAPEQRSWGIQYCSADPKGWETFLNIQAKDQAEQGKKHELMVCNNLGIEPEKFAAAKAKRATA